MPDVGVGVDELDMPRSDGSLGVGSVPHRTRATEASTAASRASASQAVSRSKS